SIADGAIRPWSTKATAWERGELTKFCRRRGIPANVAWGDLDDTQRRLVLEGDGRGQYPGIRGWFRWLEGRTYRMHVRVFLSRFRSYRLCPACAGARVKPEALDFRVGGRTIAEVNRMPIGEAAVFFGDLRLPSAQAEAVAGLILAADHAIDLGPGAGERGGDLIFAGPPAELAGARASVTGAFLGGRREIPVPRKRRRPLPHLSLRVRGASANNLEDLDVDVPLGCFVAVTGVSGSGKSTLVEEVLYRGLKKRRGEPVGIPGACREISGAERIADVVLVDQ